MRYKFELWPYDLFSFEDAENHLNLMAEKGFELVGVSIEWFPLAVYKRTAEASKKRYCVELVTKAEQEEDFFQLCEDVGWKKLVSLKNDQCVFFTEQQNAKPLFSAPTARYEHAREVVKTCDWYENNIAAAVFVIILSLLAIWTVNNSADERYSILWLLISGVVIGSISLLNLFLNKNWVKERVKRGYEEGLVEMPTWLKKMNQWEHYTGLVLVILMFGYCFIKFAIIEKSLLGACMVITIPILFTTGFIVKEIYGKNVLGIGMMFIGTVIFLTGFNLVINYF